MEIFPRHMKLGIDCEESTKYHNIPYVHCIVDYVSFFIFIFYYLVKNEKHFKGSNFLPPPYLAVSANERLPCYRAHVEYTVNIEQ